MLDLLSKLLLRYSPARALLRRECNRRIGFARYHARRAMLHAAELEQRAWKAASRRQGLTRNVYEKTGPGYLPRVAWDSLVWFDLRRAI